MNPHAYSTFRSPLWPAFKDACRVRRRPTDEHSYTAAYDEYARALPTRGREALTYRGCFLTDLHALFLWKFRRIRHYFLAPGVADFCAASVREISPDYSAALPDCPAVPAPDSGDPLISGFAIHFPACERDRSIVCIPHFTLPLDADTALYYYAAATNGEDVMLLNRDSFVDAFDDQALRMAKTIFGFSLYIAAFPEALHAGDPGQIHVAAHYRGEHAVVGRTPIIDEEDRAATSPHWRRGHFKLLSHPRFVHKRFQSVYVRGCFVRGDALEVDAAAASAVPVSA
jgi:hypothetical protein